MRIASSQVQYFDAEDQMNGCETRICRSENLMLEEAKKERIERQVAKKEQYGNRRA